MKFFFQSQEYDQAQAAIAQDICYYIQLFQTWFSKLNIDNSHIDNYGFCQQYDDNYKTAKTTGSKQVFFTTLLLDGKIL